MVVGRKSIQQAPPNRAAAVVALAMFFSLIVLYEGGIPISAQRLAIRHYDVADGLAHSNVTAILQDKKGYLWFGTFEGVSRFDGYRFTNYSIQDGLGHILINDLAEDRHGHLWVGTNGAGVSLLIDNPQEKGAADTAQRKKFVSYKVGKSGSANNVNKLIFDAAGRLWCLTDEGIYRATISEPPVEPQFELVMPSAAFLSHATFADRRGRLWLSLGNKLIQIVEDRINTYSAAEKVGGYDIAGIAEDRRGQLFVANLQALFAFIETESDTEKGGQWEKLPLSLAPGETIRSMVADVEAGLWLGTSKGLIRYQNGQQTVYSGAQGIAGGVGYAMAQDRQGNLWLNTQTGVYQLAGEMIVSYTKAEGLPDGIIAKVFEDPAGRIYAIIPDKGVVEIAGGRAVPVSGSQVSPFTRLRNILLDSRGDWWMKTDNELFRSPGSKPDFRRGKKPAEGFARAREKLTLGLHEDKAGKVWISGYEGETNFIYQFDPQRIAPSAIERIKLESDQEISPLIAMQSDRAGALWLAMHAQLGRLRHSKVTFFQPGAGLPDVYPRALFSDSRGWLWVGLRYGGVSVTEEPEAEQPVFINYSSRNGLASNTVFSITEDAAGRIYLGTGRGLDQLDPLTGRIHHFTAADGLAGTWITHCMKDSRGNIWVATTTGLSRLNLQAERAVNYPPPVYVNRIQVAGEDQVLPETGVLEAPQLELTASRNNLLIEYVGVSFQAERTLRYQYMLEGVDRDWNAPVEQQAVNYARLSPGSYRFLVRAVNQDGKTSERPAVFQFRILPPLWQRWWFVTLAALLAGLAAYRFYRYRLARLLELERVRLAIATDLHDDIGSNLSRIAILSEVATQRVDRANSQVREPLSLIAATSRELVDSMSDIVWAINPNKDHIGDLAQRMRRFASDIFTARNIEFHFHAPSAEAYLKVSADVRRQVFLIFKESVSNVVRHSACTEAEIELQIEEGRLTLTLRDNGKGFDPASVGEGNGLPSMMARAKSISGKLEIISNQKGSTVRLKVPLIATAKPQNTRLHRE